MSTSFNNTKIVATVGPATNTKEKLLELIVAGVDVFRLNFSHGKHEDHAKVIHHIKDLNKTFDYNISMLQDLQGPKIRIGEMEGGGVQINEGDEIMITNDNIVGNAERVSTTYESITKDVKAGDSIMVDDGKIELKVFKVDPKAVYTRVVYGGLLKSKKGMNLPDTDISEPSLTKKDKIDLEFGLKQGVDWIAISFVRSAADIIQLKSIIAEAGSNAKVIAKIERPEAIKNIDSIIEESDALMVARGDLGVEIAMEDVPMQQKRIVRLCNMAAKPVIVATQMMESMIENPRPTRAEANDVANAVYDGADAVMLSGETAAGKFPVETIQAMTKIITSIEREEHIFHRYYPFDQSAETFRSDVIVEAACRMSEISDAKAIIGTTSSGFTAFHLSKHRPKADLFIFTSNRALLKTLNLVWGVRAFYYKKLSSTDATFKHFENELVKRGHLRKGDTYVNTAAIPLKEAGTTNMVKLNQVTDGE